MHLKAQTGEQATVLSVERMQKATGPGNNWVLTLTQPLPANSPLEATPAQRPETGPMAFGSDWPGVFIRGDNALAYTLALQDALNHDPDNPELRSLLSLLSSCQCPAPTTVHLNPFTECLPK
jgi:hypothetical protein